MHPQGVVTYRVKPPHRTSDPVMVPSGGKLCHWVTIKLSSGLIARRKIFLLTPMSHSNANFEKSEPSPMCGGKGRGGRMNIILTRGRRHDPWATGDG